jgi:energy-converting hydrogenase Eha subunit H
MILLFFYLYGNDPLGTILAFINAYLFIFIFALIIALALLILAKRNKKVPDTSEPAKHKLRQSVGWTTEEKMREFKKSFDPTKKV